MIVMVCRIYQIPRYAKAVYRNLDCIALAAPANPLAKAI
jgi:hypothetical protein